VPGRQTEVALDEVVVPAGDEGQLVVHEAVSGHCEAELDDHRRQERNDEERLAARAERGQRGLLSITARVSPPGARV